MKNRGKFCKANNGLLEEEETGIIGLTVPDGNNPNDGSVKYITMTKTDEFDNYE